MRGIGISRDARNVGYLLAMLGQIADEGDEVTLVVPYARLWGGSSPVPVTHLFRFRGPRKLVAFLSLLTLPLVVPYLLLRFRPRFILTHELSTLMIVKIVAFFSRTKVILVRDWGDRREGRGRLRSYLSECILPYAIRFADRIFVPSEAAISLLPQVDRDFVRVHPLVPKQSVEEPGVIEPVSVSGWRALFRRPAQRVEVLPDVPVVGVWGERDETLFAEPALRALGSLGMNSLFVVIFGDLSEKNLIRTLCVGLGLEGRFALAASNSADEVQSILRECQVVLLPPTRINIPSKFVSCLESETAVLFPAQTPYEVLVDNPELRYEADNVEEIAKKLISLLVKRGEREKIISLIRHRRSQIVHPSAAIRASIYG